MNQNVIYTFKKIEMTDKEIKEILNKMQRAKLIGITDTVLNKKTLDKNESIAIETKNEFGYIDGRLTWSRTRVGLINVHVDKEKSELIGIRVIRFQGKYEFEERRYNLSNYRKMWRAYGLIRTED